MEDFKLIILQSLSRQFHAFIMLSERETLVFCYILIIKCCEIVINGFLALLFTCVQEETY